jgi:hypothetical protein
MLQIAVTDPYLPGLRSYRIIPEDHQLLIDLLHEYSDKLISICRELDANKCENSIVSRINKDFLNLLKFLVLVVTCPIGIYTSACVVIFNEFS